MAITTPHDLIDALTAEHAELLPRIARLVELAEAGQPGLAAAVDALSERLHPGLEAHIASEDDALFPAIAREMGESGTVDVFRAEHREILALRDELYAARDRGARHALADAALSLGDLLTSHMTREDAMLFPSARQLPLALPPP